MAWVPKTFGNLPYESPTLSEQFSKAQREESEARVRPICLTVLTFETEQKLSENFVNIVISKNHSLCFPQSCERSGRLHAALRHYNQAELLITMEATVKTFN